MKNVILIVLLVSLFSFCQEKAEKVEIVYEDGVEVVLNRIEPYRLKDEPPTFVLEKEFDIDFERVDLAELGIGEVEGFEVDLKGNIYFISELQLFKFDNSGEFIWKFGENGQGPGEIQFPIKWWITESNSFGFYDYGNNKFLFVNENG